MYIESAKTPSIGYLLLYATNIGLSVMVAGFVLAGNTDLVDVWAAQNDWGDNKDRNNTAIASSGVLGLTIGSIISKMITDYGRRRSILLSFAVCSVVTIPYFFTSNFWVLLSTRLIMGFFSAILINACSLYTAETIPSENQSNVGTSINLGIVSGIFFNNLFGLLLPDNDDTDGLKNDNLWIVSYSLQLAPMILSAILWLLVFRSEPI